MANIDAELDVILKAERGDEVRNAIAAAIQKIATDREYKPKTLNIGDADNHKTLKGGPWDKVVVDISGSGGASIDLDYYGVVDANGYYDLWNTGWADRFPGHGWNGFHVDVPQHDANLTVKEITENGVYDPLTEGYDGYSKVVVSVPNAAGSGDLLTVSFYNGNLFLGSTQVPYGGQAIYSGETPVSDTPFIGWNPDPSRVLNNMRCQAVFAGGLGGTIADDWITIAKNCQAGLAQSKYPIGSSKELVYYINGNTAIPYKCEMVLVAYNDQTFKSTKNKVPKTFWYSRHMLATTNVYGPLYGLDLPISLVKVSPVGNENPAALGWYNKITRPGGSQNGFRPSEDTTVVSGRTYAAPGYPTVTVESGLLNLLAPVNRMIYPAKATWSGSGTSLVYTYEAFPIPPVDSKIFVMTEAEYGKYKQLFQGLAKANVRIGSSSSSRVDISLWNPAIYDQATGETYSGERTYGTEITPEINPDGDKSRWYFDSTTGEAVEWHRDYNVICKTFHTGPGQRSGSSDNIASFNELMRFGFCI